MFSPQYYRFIFPFFMALMMSFIMSGALTYWNLGWSNHFLTIWLVNWGKALIIAYPCVLLVAPLATRISRYLCGLPHLPNQS